jgi:hypothetical protein
VAYPERGVPLSQAREDDPLLFCTQEAVHLTEMYAGDGLGRLVEERGIHIAHGYVLNDFRYVAGIFREAAGRARLAAEWTGFLDRLEEAVRSGVVCNPLVGELARYMSALQRVTVTPADGGVVVTNHGSSDIEGFTLLFEPGTPPESIAWNGADPGGTRAWPDWLAVWGMLPARATTAVTQGIR